MRQPPDSSFWRRWLPMTVTVFAVIFAGVTPIFAQDDEAAEAPDAVPPPRPTGARDDTRLLPEPRTFADSSFEFFVGYGFRVINSGGSNPDNHVFSIFSNARFSKWRVDFGVDVPIEDGKVKLRSESLNEISDWFHFVRKLQYAEKDEGPFYFLLGELRGLTGTMGHGSLVKHYHSVADFDSPKIGMQLDVDFGTFRAEALVNSFTEWNVTAVRASVRPLRLAGVEMPTFDNLAIGVTMAADWNAPQAVIVGPGGAVELNQRHNIVTDATTLLAFVLDVEWPLMQGEMVEITPYIDRVQFIDHGHGWHFGATIAIDLPILDAKPIAVRLEWRELSRDYIPEYFDSHYEIERFAYPRPSTSDTTKLAFMKAATNYSRGWFGEISWGIEKMFSFTASFADYTDDPGHELGKLMLRVATDRDLPYPFTVSFTYIKRGVSSFSDAFSLDDRALLLLEFAVEPFDDVGLRIGFVMQNIWRVRRSTGRFEAVQIYYPFVAYSGFF